MILRRPKRNPLYGPWTLIASKAYSEHEGVNLQDRGNIRDKLARYNLISVINTV